MIFVVLDVLLTAYRRYHFHKLQFFYIYYRHRPNRDVIIWSDGKTDNTVFIYI